MGPFEVGALAIIGGFALAAYKHKHKHEAGSAVSELESVLEQQRADIETLKQRVETLEKIVTDEGYSLKQKIDQL